MYGGVFQELAGSYFLCKKLRGEEVVVHAILLTGARLARGAGDGVCGKSVRFRAAAECCFTGSGGTGYYDEGA